MIKLFLKKENSRAKIKPAVFSHPDKYNKREGILMDHDDFYPQNGHDPRFTTRVEPSVGPQQVAASNQQARQELIKNVRLRLGDGIVDVELDADHYNYAIDQALRRYRQTSSNAVEESYGFLEIQPDQTYYTLPQEVIEVRQLFRRGTAGTNIGTGIQLDPFGLAFNNLYLLQTAQGSAGGLLTYDLYAQYQKSAGLLFGLYINFAWSAPDRKLTIMTRFSSTESVVIWMYNYRPDTVIINDIYAGKWILDYSVATAKLILGEARSKFSTIAGPQGGTTLNGEALKAEGLSEIQRLDEEIKTGEPGANWGMGFIIS